MVGRGRATRRGVEVTRAAPRRRGSRAVLGVVFALFLVSLVGMWAGTSAHVGTATKPAVSPISDANVRGSAAKNFVLTLTASPPKLTLGETTNLVANATGGQPPYAYSWPILPRGCASSNLSSIACTPNETGDFQVEVYVSDGSTTLHANLTLVVNAASSGSPPLSAMELYLFAGLIGVVAAGVTAMVIVSYLRRRTRRAPITPVPPAPYIPPPGQGPP